jgi:mono/diheme cytochrome c family protein
MRATGIISAVLAGFLPAVVLAAPPGSADAEFFESKVRPVLAEHCFQCHGPEKQRASLRLDSPAALLKGSDNGPVVVAGNPDQSALIRAIRYEGEVKMPPTGKLPPAAIEALTAWVKMGTPWPDTPAELAAKTTDDALAAARKNHWAFRPVQQPAVPSVNDASRARTEIDRFILAKMEEKGLQPAPAADRRTLIRRVTFDLTGLPPTPAEVEAFVHDPAADAFERLVDRLLASPHYGERWGRHWLDVARYADTTGPRLGRYPFAYTYRDWVIRSFNEDLPYDQFLLHQIAADRLPGGTDRRHLAALGFLTVGRMNNRDTVHDVIDDWIDVVTRGTLALTVGCARCHDHKFDPISIRDYYALHGIFLNSRRCDVPPLLGDGPRSVREQEYEEALRARSAAVLRFQEEQHALMTADLRTPAQIAAYLLAAEEARRLKPAGVETLSRDRDLNLFVLLRWRDFLTRTAERRAPLWASWHALATLSPKAFKTQAPALAKRLAEQLAAADSPTPHADPRQEALRRVLRGPEAPPDVPLANFDEIMAAGATGKIEAMNLGLTALWARYADAGGPPRAMAIQNASMLKPSFVFLRGNPNSRGEEVPRRFLAVLAGERPRAFTDGSGRLELASAIASPDNPLTARVLVNRVWQHHFGAGLVRTPSDFGMRGDPPSHPELLDYLAGRFVSDGWSIKKLHRLIVLSAVYQQASADYPAHRRVDPENRLLWRRNRRRLDFEVLRDSLLAVAGQLDRTMAGPPVPLFSQPAMRRRTVYGLTDRAQVPVALRAFDVANPDQHSPQRHLTTVPQQALFLMNNPFMAEQARHLARRPEVAAERSPAGRIQALYRLAFSRPARPEELALALNFLEEGKAETPAHDRPAVAPSAWQYGFGEYDAAKQRLVSFQPFPVFVSADQQLAWLASQFMVFTETWQVSHLLPDPVVGFAHLSATGGEPGEGPRHAVVRRWVAPADGTLSITGSLGHKVAPEYSDGIRAWIVSSRHGQLADWSLVNRATETKLAGVEVKAGDTIDFIVDGRATPFGDEFTWAPSLRLERPVKEEDGAQNSWDAAQDFRGPAAPLLSPWEQLALVLLQTNEIVFLD